MTIKPPVNRVSLNLLKKLLISNLKVCKSLFINCNRASLVNLSCSIFSITF